ncbi:hypothetical protein Zmor_010512 [Zophobas morio]|uniref:Uncharacterized protein n=1 Tax=Zophobas morio TaxID=2755281 RepID=A0AA38MJR6_9CUCU|nr:hypothetical protein Zmor_010512 [Zophobas morio]
MHAGKFQLRIDRKKRRQEMFLGPKWNPLGISVHKERERAANPKQNVKKENVGEQNDVTGMSTSKKARLMLLDLIIPAEKKTRQIKCAKLVSQLGILRSLE